jgi:hybrid cluster-associated redox disulfide protein
MKKITKDMLIAEIFTEHPEKAEKLGEVMINFGIHCVGCGAAMFETLEDGVLSHGFSKKELDELVEKLNEVVS